MDMNADYMYPVSCFFINPTKEFNDHIDAPLVVEKEPEEK
jgi:hypothetical protein